MSNSRKSVSNLYGFGAFFLKGEPIIFAMSEKALRLKVG